MNETVRYCTTTSTRTTAAVVAAAVAGLLVLLLTGCAQQAASEASVFEGFPVSDMSGYECFEDYSKDTVFVDVTVADVKKKMDAKETFVVYAGFKECPWCNAMLPTFNDVALDRGMTVGYINTRANPAWKSNLDIDDYDVFVEMFGDKLKVDDDGTPHLYVPHVFFVKDGVLVADHAGTIPEQTQPSQELTDAQLAQLRSVFEEKFDALK